VALLTLNTSATATQMAEEILGEGFTNITATYFGDNDSSGIYSNADTAHAGLLPSDIGVIFSTGDAIDFSNAGGGNNNGGTSTNTSGINNDADFNAAAGGATFDASFLVINFTPEPGQTQLNLEFRFYSEEYNEYVYSNFNDVALVMFDDNEVPISVGDGKISVNSINDANQFNPSQGSEALDPNPGNGQFDSSSPNLYIDNSTGAADTEFDGFTVTLSLDITVTPGVNHELKIGVADKGDSFWDSAFAIASNVTGGVADVDPVASDDVVNVVRGQGVVADLLSNDTDPDNPGTLEITEINGVSVVAGQTVTLATGQQITLNIDGTITVAGNSAPSGQTFFAYTIEDADGNSDSAFVTLNTPPCFTPGTSILTATGNRPVEELRPGDLIVTRDRGLQPLRWVGEREVTGAALFATNGSMAPIIVPAGSFGPGLPARDLIVSPMHKLLLSGARLPLIIGTREALVPARHLIGYQGIFQRTGTTPVRYLHLLFDQHEVVFSAGTPTESLHPGSIGLHGFSKESRESLFLYRPELRADPNVYGPTARHVLTPQEVRATLAA
jgi:hypothetical protein